MKTNTVKMKRQLLFFLMLAISISSMAGDRLSALPYPILGGELSNSATTSVEDIDEVMPRMKALGLNTVLVPAYWELMEPVEGQFDFTLIDRTIDVARQEQLHVIFLWFGAWKNSMSCYAPGWFKQDTKRFPRAVTADGKPMEIASCFSDNVLQADLKAFSALMKRIKERDQQREVVIMMQIENEIGMLESARDHSPLAEKAYQKERWAERYGTDDYADEQFMALYYARYVEHLAKAARQIHDMPLYVTLRPQDGGKVKNRLFIPESRCCENSGVRALYAFGEHQALGFSPFAIDQASSAETASVTKSYALLRQIFNYLPSVFKSKTWGLLFDQDDKERVIDDDGVVMTCRHFFTLPWDPRATDGSVWPEGGAMLIRLGKYDYLLAGSGVVVDFKTPSEKQQEQQKQLGEDGFAEAGNAPGQSSKAGKRFHGKRLGLLSVDEVKVDSEGKLKYLSRHNGDQSHQGRHARISVGDWKLLHIRLYEYE